MIEVREQAAPCDIRAGILSYVDASGIMHTEDFVVRCCPLNEDSLAQAQAEYNDQFTDAVMMLRDSGYHDIRYSEIKPSPFF